MIDETIKPFTSRGNPFDIDIMLPPWIEHALCAQVDTDIFFPEKGESTRPAKDVCAMCPVAAECLNYALDNDERFGVWGGLSERERRNVKAALSGATSPAPVCALPGCDAAITTDAVSGRPKTYCGLAHQQEAARIRKAAKENQP